ncbi:hypothetical protein CC2G_000031 [Coprinopsis cinerea AmutBmut pab1-1]|nr:hypothetical protein CC2G_000031 [Coprinopsis cinerea AmutBmut pab1-1]
MAKLPKRAQNDENTDPFIINTGPPPPPGPPKKKRKTRLKAVPQNEETRARGIEMYNEAKRKRDEEEEQKKKELEVAQQKAEALWKTSVFPQPVPTSSITCSPHSIAFAASICQLNGFL